LTKRRPWIVRDRCFVGAAAFVACIAPGAAFADPVDVANSIRSEGCANLPAVDQPLRAQARLQEAARLVAGGDELEKATSESGYRAKKSASLRIRTDNGDDAVAQLIAQHFCDIVADKSLLEAGAYRRGNTIWMVFATPLAPPEQEEDAAAAGRLVIDLVNEARSQGRRCGRRKFEAATVLAANDSLGRAARKHAQDMAAHSLLGHEGTDKSVPAERATQAGYAWASVAENVAGGQTTAGEVVKVWLASPGHCANLMNPRYSETGVARAVDPDSQHVVYWVQVFAAPE
jgi:uncharacterized protein YkwD